MQCKPPMAGLKLIQIDEGLSLWVASEVDAKLEAQQLKPQNQVYIGPASGGLVQLHPGDTVVDVGANIGSFARLASCLVESKGRVVAIEPLPTVFEAMERNTEVHASWCAARHIAAAPIEAVQAGIVPCTKRQMHADFTIFPRCTALSCLSACRDDADATQATQSIVTNDPARPVSFLQALGRSIARGIPWVYAPLHSFFFKALFLRGAHPVSCPVATLGQIMDTHDIQEVDLLKINVERGEMGVLLSVPVKKWPQIKQVAMQLHDRQGALDAIYALLGTDGPGGFPHIRHWKEPRFVGCCLFQVYASRCPPPIVGK